MAIYHFLVLSAFILCLPALPLVLFLSKKRRANLVQRMGFFTGFSPLEKQRPRIWIHALSVGEVRSALPFVKGLKKQYPDVETVFTAATKTGFETAGELYCSSRSPQVDQLGYFPFDLPFAVGRVIRRIDPDLVCLVETDLWPGFLNTMKKKGIPAVLINARLSDRSFRGYRRLGKMARLFFSGLSCILVQTPRDAERFRALGVEDSRIRVSGNIKFDQPRMVPDDGELSDLRSRFGIAGTDRVWIAGSTHPGEEEILLGAFQQVRQTIPELKMILAPRDPGRSKKLQELAADCGFSPALLSRAAPWADVILVDGLGFLARSYAFCDAAFIGGSLLPFGGHNPLEPAMFEKPVLFGPHMTDFHDIADLLLSRQGAFRVTSAAEVAGRLHRLLTDTDLARKTGAAAFQVFNDNAGAVDKTLQQLDRLDFLEPVGVTGHGH